MVTIIEDLKVRHSIERTKEADVTTSKLEAIDVTHIKAKYATVSIEVLMVFSTRPYLCRSKPSHHSR